MHLLRVEHKHWEICVHFTNKVIKTSLYFPLSSEKIDFNTVMHAR